MVPVLPRYLRTTCSLLTEGEEEVAKTSVADYVALRHQNVHVDGMTNDILWDGTEDDFDVEEIKVNSTESAELTEPPEGSDDTNDILWDGNEADFDVKEINKGDFDIEEIILNSTASAELVEPPDRIDDFSEGQTQVVDEENILDSTESADLIEPHDGIGDVDEVVMNELLHTPETPEEDDFYDEQSDDDIRGQVLSVALDNVPLYGWSMKSIEMAVEALELSPASAEMFKRGALDLVLFFIEEANNTLTEHLAKQSKEVKLDTEDARAEFIEKAIKIRLQMIIPYIESWPQALTLMASPMAAQEVFDNGTNLIDEIWYHAGDVATDMSWYAKRAALAAIYCTTELHMLNDKSVDYIDTWTFLHRRLNDAKAVNSVKDSLASAAGDTLALVGAGITTAQNILGMGSKKR